MAKHRCTKASSCTSGKHLRRLQKSRRMAQRSTTSRMRTRIGSELIPGLEDIVTRVPDTSWQARLWTLSQGFYTPRMQLGMPSLDWNYSYETVNNNRLWRESLSDNQIIRTSADGGIQEPPVHQLPAPTRGGDVTYYWSRESGQVFLDPEHSIPASGRELSSGSGTVEDSQTPDGADSGAGSRAVGRARQAVEDPWFIAEYYSSPEPAFSEQRPDSQPRYDPRLTAASERDRVFVPVSFSPRPFERVPWTGGERLYSDAERVNAPSSIPHLTAVRVGDRTSYIQTERMAEQQQPQLSEREQLLSRYGEYYNQHREASTDERLDHSTPLHATQREEAVPTDVGVRRLQRAIPNEEYAMTADISEDGVYFMTSKGTVFVPMDFLKECISDAEDQTVEGA